METAIILSSIMGLGYLLSGSKEDIRNVQINDSINAMPAIEKPNSMNIYNSNRVNSVNEELLQMSLENYKQAQDPSLTGVLPPIFNSYGSKTNDYVTDVVTLRQLAEINNINKTKNVLAQPEPQPVMQARPMFQVGTLGESLSQNNYANFGQQTYVDEEESLLTGKSILRTDRIPFNIQVGQNSPLDKKNVSGIIESYENTKSASYVNPDRPRSLLSDMELETTHNNMVPFFGSNVKQNISNHNINENVLDLYTGKTSYFKKKKEIEPFFNVVQENIYGTPIITETIEKDRYIASNYKQGERPFYPQRVAAPVAGQPDNPITQAAADVKTVDELRAANKPKLSYEGRTVAGQMGNVRGYQAEVNKNLPDRHFELGPARVFTSTGAVIAPKVKENYENIQPTSRQSQNIEYYGPLQSDKPKSTQRLTSIDNSHELLTDAIVQDSKRNQLRSDTERNIGSIIPQTHDYGKSSYNLPQLQRDTTNSSHELNAQQTDKGYTVRLLDDVKNTNRETLDKTDYSGNIKTTFDVVLSSAYSMGNTGIDTKTTQKESLVENKYKGNPNKKDAMGYMVFNAYAKPTQKEISVRDVRNASHVSSYVDAPTIYSTYKDPVKIKVPTHIEYSGNPHKHVSSEESREQFDNAEISNTKEQAVMGERPAGQSGSLAFVPGSKAIIGETKLTDNMLLKSDENTYIRGKDNISSVIPHIHQMGIVDHSSNSLSSIENTRMNGIDIKQQLKENPYYNLK